MNLELAQIINDFEQGQSISINGIGLGTSMEQIDYNMLDSIDPNVKYSRSYRNKKVFKVDGDGNELELSPLILYNEVKEFGGWLRSKNISWYIKNRTVHKFFLFRSILELFEIDNEAKILEHFGKPEFLLMGRQGLQYHYPTKKTQLIWSKRDSSLTSISVGHFVCSNEEKEKDSKNGIFYVNGIKKIQISNLKQQYIYEGLLEGRPTVKMNDQIISSLKKEAEVEFSSPVYVIEPVRTEPKLRRPYRFGKPENLPPISCVAVVRSIDPAREEDADGSCLVIIWFQDKLAMPVEETIQSQIESLSWDDLASDIYY